MDAFRFMAQAKHIGKIVFSFKEKDEDRVDRSRPIGGGNGKLDSRAAYLITGGLAGLGLQFARWVVEKGGRHLVLTGRSEPSEEALAAIRGLEGMGAEVVVARGDVSDPAHLKEIFAKFGHSLPPLRGIIHSAGMLDDGVLVQQTWERFANVLAPKVAGTWHLHTLSQGMPLDFFVLFSSAVSILGSPGQGNHAAACAFEDAFAHYRRALGLPALSINWGPWAEIGAATRRNVNERLRTQGFQAIAPRQGLKIFEELLGRELTQIAVISADWPRYFGSLPDRSRSEFFSDLETLARSRRPPEPPSAPPKPALLRRLNEAPPNSRRKLLLEFVRSQAIKLLGLDPTQPLDDRQPLSDLGLDSLMAVELRSLLSAELELNRSLPATLVFDYPSTSALTDYLAEEVLALGPGGPRSAPRDAAKDERSADLLDRIERLTDEEVDRLTSRDKEGTRMADFLERISNLSPKKLILIAKDLQARLEALEKGPREPIAVIGIGCRFPGGADNPETFWRLLRDGRDAVTEVPPDRWDNPSVYDPDPGNPEKCPPDAAASSRTSTGSIRSSSASRPAKPSAWTRSSGCFWRSPGRPWRTPANRRIGWRAPGRACLSASAAATMPS